MAPRQPTHQPTRQARRPTRRPTKRDTERRQGPDVIEVSGAREHNLKDVSVSIPRGQLVVLTGVSGSGKSSLAFDTIFAEGQRRYVESLSAYARQFLGHLRKPDVDSIEGLSPSVAIDQKTASANPRSTVGTVTEIHDYLRLAYARIGTPHCPNDNSPLGIASPQATADRVAHWPEGTPVLVLAPVVSGRKGTHHERLAELARSGFSRVRLDGRIQRLDEIGEVDKNLRHDIDVVVDRITVGPTEALRLTEALETALAAADGTAWVEPEAHPVPDTKPSATPSLPTRLVCSARFGCPVCGEGYLEPEPRTFSFNSPYGACVACDGLGTRFEGDPEAIVPDPTRSLRDGALAPWTGLAGRYQRWALETMCAAEGIPMDTPFRDLSKPRRRKVLEGTKDKVYDTDKTYRDSNGRRQPWLLSYQGPVTWLAERFQQAASDREREQIEGYLREVPCGSCGGSRLAPFPRAVTIADRAIHQVSALSVTGAVEFFDELELDDRQTAIASGIMREVKARLNFLTDVGLGYLTLDRGARTLSGGEAQRIRLASQVGSGLTGVLYVLDEPSIGLHPRDTHRLLATLERLRDLGNTVLVVEHDEDTIRAADWIIDVGPAAGELGGTIVAQGDVTAISRARRSQTGAYLAGRRAIATPSKRRAAHGTLWLRGVEEHNLADIDAGFPLGCLTVVTGVSGSGKSSLVVDVLEPTLAKALHKSRRPTGKFRRIEGVDQVDKVISIDQSPIGRTPRSNPATYTGMFDKIRALFATLPESKVRGYAPGRFSFNVPSPRGGRCESCSGEGMLKIEMHFLPDVWVPCEVCQGRRYNRDTLEVRFKGHNIADVLDLTVASALELFKNQPPIVRTLQTLSDVGLGYLRLGQPATQLSGGEAQRVKLSSELARRSTGHTVYVLDEPTTGLHLADVEHLVAVLGRLVDAGNTVIVVEHQPDVMRVADWIIDLGPDAGANGGTIVAEGTPETVATSPESHTAKFLAAALAAHPPV